ESRRSHGVDDRGDELVVLLGYAVRAKRLSQIPVWTRGACGGGTLNFTHLFQDLTRGAMSLAENRHLVGRRAHARLRACPSRRSSAADRTDSLRRCPLPVPVTTSESSKRPTRSAVACARRR